MYLNIKVIKNQGLILLNIFVGYLGNRCYNEVPLCGEKIFDKLDNHSMLAVHHTHTVHSSEFKVREPILSSFIQIVIHLMTIHAIK